MNLSYWELDSYFTNVDYTIIGSGIVGLSTAYHLHLKHPNAKIIVLEKGTLPEGASTKNAGFACFGSVSEIIDYLKFHPQNDIYQLIERRYLGLKKLRSLISDQAMNYQQNGGYELFRQQDEKLMTQSFEQLDEINEFLEPIFGAKPFQVSSKDFGFKGIIGAIETPFEGQIHTGKMMRKWVELVTSVGIPIVNRTEVKELNEMNSGIEISTTSGITFKTHKAFLCTNAFTKNLVDLDVVPARAQVLITKPIANLSLKGCFHMDQGFYYFRNIQDRILLGGARNLDFEGETTTEFATSDRIQKDLEKQLNEIICPNQTIEIEHRWSGIMGMGSQRNPIIKQISDHLYCGVRLTGTGVAIGSLVGEELANLLD